MSLLKSSAAVVVAQSKIQDRQLSIAPARPRIGLMDHMGGGNLGDDATQVSVIQNLRSRWPDAEIYGFTLNPDDTSARHGIPSYSIRTRTWSLGNNAPVQSAGARAQLKAAAARHPVLFWPVRAVYAGLVRAPRALFREMQFLARSFRNLRSFDLFVISGGGQLTEAWGGPWGFPYTIFKWMLLARMAGLKRIVFNVGAGPLTRPLSNFFVRRALFLADYVSFRDEKSRALAGKIGFTGRSEVFPDAVYGIEIPVAQPPAKIGRAPVVGFAPMAYSDPRVDRNADPSVYIRLIDSMGQFGAWLVEQSYSLKLFCSDIGVDPPAVEDLYAMLRIHSGAKSAQSITTPSIKSNADLFQAVSSMDYVVTCRFHGVIFAHIMNKPVLALSHHPKVTALMDELGLSEYCLDIKTGEVEVFKNAFLSMVANADAIRSRMSERLGNYRQRLSAQFDVLFPPKAATPATEAWRQKNECA